MGHNSPLKLMCCIDFLALCLALPLSREQQASSSFPDWWVVGCNEEANSESHCFELHGSSGVLHKPLSNESSGWNCKSECKWGAQKKKHPALKGKDKYSVYEAMYFALSMYCTEIPCLTVIILHCCNSICAIQTPTICIFFLLLWVEVGFGLKVRSDVKLQKSCECLSSNHICQWFIVSCGRCNILSKVSFKHFKVVLKGFGLFWMKVAFLYSFVFLYLYANVVSMTAESKSVTNLGTIMVNYVSPAADLHTSM